MMFKRLLAIETSSAQLSLAIGHADGVLIHYRSPLAWRHAEALLKAMRQLLARARWPVQTLEGIVVSTGPGSFTGIRIGLASARALGQSLEIPVVGVSSLETLAAGLIQPSEIVCPVIDALRGDVFTALFEQSARGLHRVWDDERMPREMLEKKLKSVEQKGRKVRKIQDTYPDARALLKVGAPRLVKAGRQSYRTVLPTYLRDAAAQERRAAAV